MFVEDHEIENAAHTEDITDRQRFGIHILDIDDLWCDIARCSASNKKVLGLIGNGGESKINYNGLFTDDDIIRFKITMYDIFTSHLAETTEDTLHYEFAFRLGVFLHTASTTTH
jgi:hypothetical protein